MRPRQHYARKFENTTLFLQLGLSFTLIGHEDVLQTGGIDLFSLGGLLPHFRPCDDILENFAFKF